MSIWKEGNFWAAEGEERHDEGVVVAFVGDCGRGPRRLLGALEVAKPGRWAFPPFRDVFSHQDALFGSVAEKVGSDLGVPSGHGDFPFGYFTSGFMGIKILQLFESECVVLLPCEQFDPCLCVRVDLLAEFSIPVLKISAFRLWLSLMVLRISFLHHEEIFHHSAAGAQRIMRSIKKRMLFIIRACLL